MPRFFVAASDLFGGVAYLSAREAEHLRVLRIRKGECFTVCDGAGTDYTCRLKKTGDGGAEAEVVSCAPSSGEPSVRVAVYAAFSKGDKLDMVVQKAVEIGASEFVVFPSERCVSKPGVTATLHKTSRLQKIAEEAAKQSGRGKIPLVTATHSFELAVMEASKAELALFLYEDEKNLGFREALKAAPEAKTISLVTGPEGGFTPEEAFFAVSSGLKSVNLGPRILRCETAPLCALSVVMYATNNL